MSTEMVVQAELRVPIFQPGFGPPRDFAVRVNVLVPEAAAVVSQAEGHPARPWWEFTPERKAREAREKRAGKEKA
jgi:hypothetical protein